MMALLFRPGGPQVGAVRAPALAAGVTALGGLGAIPAASIPLIPDLARLPSSGERRAPTHPAIANAISSDRGRFSV
jgi:hypothetical protein